MAANPTGSEDIFEKEITGRTHNEQKNYKQVMLSSVPETNKQL